MTFGGQPATNVVWVSPTLVTCSPPPHAAGAVDVTVRNPDGSTATLVSGYTYGAAIPTPMTVFGSGNVLAWFRGDVGSTSSWTDQGPGGNTATAVGTPTSTVLGGKAAFSLAGGAKFDGASNLITAGAARTVLAVGKALDATGGALFTFRQGHNYNSSLILTLTGTNYFYSDGAVSLSTLSPTVTTEAQSPFLAEWKYAGSGTPGFRMNRSDRSAGGGAQTSETGTTGFEIGSNSDAQAWNGIIGEIVVVSGLITPTQRTDWENAVLAYWGF